MGRRLSLPLVCLAGLATACGFFIEPTPDVANPKTASVGGVEVSYPGNWKTELETSTQNGVEIGMLTIESSGNAVAMVQVFQPGPELGVDEVYGLYLDGLKEAAKTEVGGVLTLESRGAPSSFSHALFGQPAEGRTGNHEISLLGEKVPHRFQTIHQELDERTVVVIVQAPTEDWAKVEPGFELVYDGLRVE